MMGNITKEMRITFLLAVSVLSESHSLSTLRFLVLDVMLPLIFQFDILFKDSLGHISHTKKLLT